MGIERRRRGIQPRTRYRTEEDGYRTEKPKNTVRMVILLPSGEDATRVTCLETDADVDAISIDVVKDLHLITEPYQGPLPRFFGGTYVPELQVKLDWHVPDRYKVYASTFAVFDKEHSADFDVLLGGKTIEMVGFYPINNTIWGNRADEEGLLHSESQVSESGLPRPKPMGQQPAMFLSSTSHTSFEGAESDDEPPPPALSPMSSSVVELPPSRSLITSRHTPRPRRPDIQAYLSNNEDSSLPRQLALQSTWVTKKEIEQYAAKTEELKTQRTAAPLTSTMGKPLIVPVPRSRDSSLGDSGGSDRDQSSRKHLDSFRDIPELKKGYRESPRADTIKQPSNGSEDASEEELESGYQSQTSYGAGPNMASDPLERGRSTFREVGFLRDEDDLISEPPSLTNGSTLSTVSVREFQEVAEEIAVLLLQDPILGPLYPKALDLVEIGDFERKFAKILKVCASELRIENKDGTQQQAVRLLQTRANLIVTEMGDRLDPTRKDLADKFKALATQKPRKVLQIDAYRRNDDGEPDNVEPEAASSSGSSAFDAPEAWENPYIAELEQFKRFFLDSAALINLRKNFGQYLLPGHFEVGDLTNSDQSRTVADATKTPSSEIADEAEQNIPEIVDNSWVRNLWADVLQPLANPLCRCIQLMFSVGEYLELRERPFQPGSKRIRWTCMDHRSKKLIQQLGQLARQIPIPAGVKELRRQRRQE
ncbi:MAG: hypothetical protein Q9226_004298 [Calogaya cf. arnoldii]